MAMISMSASWSGPPWDTTSAATCSAWARASTAASAIWASV